MANPPRKVSNLVSYFQTLSDTPQASTSSSSLPKPNPQSTSNRSNARPLPSIEGKVSAHVRRLSVNVPPTGSSSSTSISRPKATARTMTYDTPPEAAPTPSIPSRSSFKPRRLAPPPPPALTSGTSPAIVVPATVHSVKEHETKLEVTPRKHANVAPTAAVRPRKETETSKVEVEMNEDIRIAEEKTGASVPRAAGFTPPSPALTITPPRSPHITPPLIPPPTKLAHPLQSTPASYSNPPILKSPPVTPPRLPFSAPLSSPTFSSSPRSTTDSARTTTVHAASIFKRDAEPLHLPDLDAYLASLEEPHFTPLDAPGFMSEQEKQSFNKYLEDVKKVGWWTKLKRAFTIKKQGVYTDLEKSPAAAESRVDDDRKDVFPPMHLLPPDVTLSNMKENLPADPLLTVSQTMGTVVDLVLAVEASSFGISMETVESFRDVLQMITLLISSPTAAIEMP